MKKVVIIGANIAGLNCALNLDLSKFSVLVIDKSINPGLKTCAGGISAKCSQYIPSKFYEKTFDKMVVWFNDDRMEINRKHRPLHTINREAYIKYLIAKCKKKGIKVILGKNISSHDIHSNYISISKAKKRHFDYLIGADGYGSCVRKKLKLKNKYHHLIEAKTKKKFKNMILIIEPEIKGYFWIFPHKSYCSIGCGIKTEYFKKFCKKINLSYYDVKGGCLQYHYQGHRFNNILLIGEAAGLVSKLTGEGIYYAIISAIETAKELNTDKKSKKLEYMISKLTKDTLIKGVGLYLLGILLVKFTFGRKIIANLAEKLSIKGVKTEN